MDVPLGDLVGSVVERALESAGPMIGHARSVVMSAAGAAVGSAGDSASKALSSASKALSPASKDFYSLSTSLLGVVAVAFAVQAISRMSVALLVAMAAAIAWLALRTYTTSKTRKP